MQVPATEKRLKNHKPRRHTAITADSDLQGISGWEVWSWLRREPSACRQRQGCSCVTQEETSWWTHGHHVHHLTVMSIFAFTLTQHSLSNEFQMTFVSPRGSNLLRKQQCDPENWRNLLFPLFKMQKSLTTYFRRVRLGRFFGWSLFGKRCCYGWKYNSLWILRVVLLSNISQM